VFQVFQSTFWSSYAATYKDEVARTLESFTFIVAVNRVSYDFDENVITFEVTMRDGFLTEVGAKSWREQAWRLFYEYGRTHGAEVLGGVSDTISGVKINWSEWTPALTVTGNGLSASCPGRIIVAISESKATQAEIEDGCTFAPG
jgi:hypothetical protein